MRCRAGSQQVSAYLREYVAREWETRGLSQGRSPEPACDAADLHGVGHPVVARPSLQTLLHVVRPPPVLANADRGSRLLGDTGVPSEVVGAGRFLDPVEALLIEDTHTL